MKQHSIPEDWSLFISIASYRDLFLLQTIKSLIDQATHPERLRIIIYNQFDYWHDWDRKQNLKLYEYIEEVKKQENSPKFVVENIWHTNAKNVYYARSMIEHHYKGETY